MMSQLNGVKQRRRGSFVFESVNDEPIRRSSKYPDGLPGHLAGTFVRRKYVGKLVFEKMRILKVTYFNYLIR